MNNIFISQTTGTSAEFSKHVCSWLETSPLNIKPWAAYNGTDLGVGPYSHQRIVKAAQECSSCISIVTEENLSAPWLNFEAGLFFAKPDHPVVTMLCGRLEHSAIKGSHPIQPIFSVSPRDAASLFRLLQKLNEMSGDEKKTEKTLETYIKSSMTNDLILEHEKIFNRKNSAGVDAKNGLVI